MLWVAGGFNSSLGCSVRRAATQNPDAVIVRGALGLEEPTPFVSLRRSVARGFRARANPLFAMRLSVTQPNAQADGS